MEVSFKIGDVLSWGERFLRVEALSLLIYEFLLPSRPINYTDWMA
jgi:hypothetical protein